MERRQHPRIELPIEIELAHPSLGVVRTVARDISEGGLFAPIETTAVTVGAKVKVTVLGLPVVSATATPTIGMEVARVAPDGLGLRFDGIIARHLWNSVERYRDEATIGRDYFQIYQAALVVDATNRLLVVQQNGRWLFPGDYLQVGQDWRPALATALAKELGLNDAQYEETLGVDSLVGTLPENAVFAVFHRYSTRQSDPHLASDSRFRQFRWIKSDLDLRELSFSDERLRVLAHAAMDRAREETAD